MKAKTSEGARKARTGSKRALIEAIGLYKPVAQILAAARTKGVIITAPYVYGLRKRLASGAAKRPPGRPKGSIAKGAKMSRARLESATKGGTSASDRAFRRAAAHMIVESGVVRARQVLEEVVSKIRASSERA